METILSKDKSAGFDMEKVKAYGLSGLSILGGFIGGHLINTLINKTNSWVMPVVGMVAGFAGAIMLQNPWLKLVCLGVMAYGAIKSLNTLTAAATAPGTQGLAGFLSESLKEKIKKFVPQLGSMEDYAGTQGVDDVLGNMNLDDPINGTEDADYEEVSSHTSGQSVGSIAHVL